MNITWNGKTSNPRRVLQKKSVRFTESTQGGLSDYTPTHQTFSPTPYPPTPHPNPLPPPPPPPFTQTSTPPPHKASWFKTRILRMKNPDPDLDYDLDAKYPITKQNSSPTESTESFQSWHHHPSYFPEYTPLFPKDPSKFDNPYAQLVTLTEAERQALIHSETVGRSIVVHYPVLPSFAEYSNTPTLASNGKSGNSSAGKSAGGSSGGGSKGGSNIGWQSTKWGVEGWTGFGWEGNVLPTSEGLTFADPMVKGVAEPPPTSGNGNGGGGKGKNNKKNESGSGGNGGSGEGKGKGKDKGKQNEQGKDTAGGEKEGEGKDE